MSTATVGELTRRAHLVPETGDAAPPARARAAALGVLVALLAVYAATLAPDVTLWDSGEFNAAIASLGIPHPPGTPLYVLLASAWVRLLGVLPQAAAVNALSAAATAVACALLARSLARWTGSAAGGVAAGLAAGGMLAVWQNATETEVYALSLLLAIAMVAAGDRAGRTGRARDQAIVAYLIALAVPLQISALVAAPAAILLAASPATPAVAAGAGRGGRGALAVRSAVALGGVFLVVAGLGVVSPPLMLAGGVLLLGSGFRRARRDATPRTPPAWALAALVALGASVLLFMLVRAPHDPGVNQGNPATWQAFVDVVARRQYEVPGLWPRRAPFWLQLANLTQYADWQVAFALDDSVAASWRRTPFTLLFGALGVVGAVGHWRRDRRSARATTLLLLSASLGVVAVLNLRAGPSIGAGVLPPDALHEARERDYFFALAFAVAGAWAGLGAVALAARVAAGKAWLGVGLAALPIALNWGAVDRRREPDASLAPLLGEALLESAPPNAVLLLAGDNDSYAVWYQQEVHGRRRDVTPVTLPLLGADWYRAELARRHALLDADAVALWRGEPATLERIATAAQSQERILAASAAVGREVRLALGPRWALRGLVFERRSDGHSARAPLAQGLDEVDLEASRRVAGVVAARISTSEAPPRDGTARYIHRLLQCPAQGAALAGGAASGDRQLDSFCNFK